MRSAIDGYLGYPTGNKCMPKATIKAARVGPWHARKALAFIDLRSQEGSFCASLREELLRDQGLAPSTGRRLLVDMVTFSALMVSRLYQPMAKGEELSAEQREELRAWQREVRENLRTLGVDKVEQQLPALAELLAEKVARRAASATRKAAA